MEEKDVQRLLDMLYGMVDEAKSAAFSSEKCVINRDEVLDLLDEIRGKLPLELKKAQELLRARDTVRPLAAAPLDRGTLPRPRRDRAATGWRRGVHVNPSRHWM